MIWTFAKHSVGLLFSLGMEECAVYSPIYIYHGLSSSKKGTPELNFTDPDGIRLQIQDVRSSGGSGYLGDQRGTASSHPGANAR